MPVRPRHAATETTAGVACRNRKGVSLAAALGAVVAAVGPRARVAESFVVPEGGALVHALASRRVSRTSPTATVEVPTRTGRFRRTAGRDRGRAVALALMASRRDDEDQFDAELDDSEMVYFEEEDDMGFGVSNTIKNKKPRRPRPDEVDGRENPILELANAAQEMSDMLRPDDDFEKYKRKETGEADDASRPRASMGDEEEEDIGMGVSETVTPPERSETFGDDDATAKAVAAVLGGDQIKEMEGMAAKDMQRGQMVERGLSQEQIAAYMGDDLSVQPKTRAEKIGDKALEEFQKAAFEDSRAWRDEDELLQVAPSSSLVKTDEKGDPFLDRFVYVDEYTCIGCTHCSHTAPSTFFMEGEHGRARVYQQGRDKEEAVRDAILTCPVDCIHYVDWPELKKLETEREGIDINFKAKLVGNDHDNSRNGQQSISGNQGMRCENCPSRGCYNCPMFGVGHNPEYTKRQAERKTKRAARLKKEQEDITGEVRTAEL